MLRTITLGDLPMCKSYVNVAKVEARIYELTSNLIDFNPPCLKAFAATLVLPLHFGKSPINLFYIVKLI